MLDDNTIFLNMDGQTTTSELPASIKPVAVSRDSLPIRNMGYVAQQTSLESYTSGLNPLVNAAVPLLLTIIRLGEDGQLAEGSLLVVDGGHRPGVTSDELANLDMESLRTRLEAEVRGFESQALASNIESSQVLAARYLLCTAVDEAITTSHLGSDGGWSKLALLSTFHNETWGGEKFFQILDRTMQQPARNLYLLELMYLLLSLGFGGKFRVLDRGPIAIESLRGKIYRQVKLLRGEPGHDLSKKVEPRPEGSKTFAYIPTWLVAIVVLFCVGVTLFGFSTVLENRAEPILNQLKTVSMKQRV